ncbi:hypothetical protein ACTFIV_010796 [Dictyostelium citrinum]
MDELFKKVFNNKFIRKLIFKYVSKPNGYKYDDIHSLSWICSNGYFGLAYDKLKFNKHQLTERFGMLNIFELITQMDSPSASQLLKYLLTEHDFDCYQDAEESKNNNNNNNNIEIMIRNKRNQFFTCLPSLDYITESCSLEDILLLESVIPNDLLSNVTSTDALDKAPLNPNLLNRHLIVKHLLKNRNEGCSFRALINSMAINDLKLLKYIIEENKQNFNKIVSYGFPTTTTNATTSMELESPETIIGKCIRTLNIELLEYVLVEFPKLGFDFSQLNWFTMIEYSLQSISPNQYGSAATMIYFSNKINTDKVLLMIKYIVENKITSKDRELLSVRIKNLDLVLNSFLFCIMNSLIDVLDYLINQSKLITLPIDQQQLSQCFYHQYLYSISYESLVFCHNNGINVWEFKKDTFSINDLQSFKFVKEHNLSDKFSISCIDLESVKYIFENFNSTMDVDGILIECAAVGELSTLIYLSQVIDRSNFTEELAHVALKEKKLDVIRFLYHDLSIEIDLSYLLMVATANNDPDTVKMIFQEFKLDPSLITQEFLTACCLKPEGLELFKYLYSICPQKKKPTIPISTLNNCIKLKLWDTVNWLLDNIFNNNNNSSNNNSNNNSKVIDCGISNLRIVKRLIENGFVFSKKSFNNCFDNVKVLEYIHNHFPKQECTTEAIDLASRHDCYNSVKFLLDNRSEGYDMAIQFCLTRGWFEIIELLSSTQKYKDLHKPSKPLKQPLYFGQIDQIITINSSMMLSIVIGQNGGDSSGDHNITLPITGQQITNAIKESGHLSIFTQLLNVSQNINSPFLNQCLIISLIFNRPHIINYLRNKLSL